MNTITFNKSDIKVIKKKNHQNTKVGIYILTQRTN